jgi:hypothetical protein
VKQVLNRALVAHSKPALLDEPSPRKRPTFRPKEGWLTYNINRQIDQSIILTSFTALVDGLTEQEVWQHYTEGRRGTCPRLVLKILAVRFLFQQSAARALGITDLLRGPLNISPMTIFPSDSTLDYRLRSGVFTNLFERLLTLTVAHLEEETAAIDSTGFQNARGKAKTWNTHGKKQPRGWRKAHIVVGTKSHRIYAITQTPGEAGDAPQAKPLLQKTRERGPHLKKVVGDTAYASRPILTEAERLGLQPTMKLRDDATLKSLSHPAWPRMVQRKRTDPEAYAREYHQRSNIESTNGSWKHRIGDRLWMRHPTGQDGELRLKAILHNLGCPHPI